jgi:hypothetical protein
MRDTPRVVAALLQIQLGSFRSSPAGRLIDADLCRFLQQPTGLPALLDSEAFAAPAGKAQGHRSPLPKCATAEMRKSFEL